jgi:hypothetical protein
MLVKIATFQPWDQRERLFDQSRDMEVRVPPNIEAMWDEAELANVGLARPAPFVPPQGKQKTGAARYESDGAGGVREVFDVEDIPAPPPPLTDAERLEATIGLTVAQIKAVLDVPGPPSAK